MQLVIYFILALFATIIGSLTGMGGGVIIKPLNKKCKEKTVENAFNAVQLSVLGITVFNIFKNILSQIN